MLVDPVNGLREETYSGPSRLGNILRKKHLNTRIIYRYYIARFSRRPHEKRGNAKIDPLSKLFGYTLFYNLGR